MESKTCRRKMDLDLDFQRKILDKLRFEMEKRDKILDLLVSGGDVTLVNQNNQENQSDNDNGDNDGAGTGTKTFELLIRQIPYKVETVTLNPINWDELSNLLEKETQDDVNLDQKITPLPAKRPFRLSELEHISTATSTCESEPVEKQMKLEKKASDFLRKLPEFSMDSSFFENDSPSATTSKSKSKFLFRLHDDSTDKICAYDISHSRSSTSTQKSVSVFELSLQEIQDALNVLKNSNLQIWCDVKDFDIFSASIQPFFQLYGKFIYHFSVWLRHSPGKEKSLLNSNLLMCFILQNFPSLEFLSINSEMMTHLDDLNLNAMLNFPPSPRPLKLEFLKTLKIVPSIKNQERFSAVFLAKLLKRTPRLESIHGMPLNCIKETAELDKILIEDAKIEDPLIWIGASIPKLAIRSCFTVREIYYADPQKFPKDLMKLCNFETRTGNGIGNGRMVVALEEFNAERYFIKDPIMREKSGQLISRILQMNNKTLVKLRLEPNTNPQTALAIPRLENLKTLRFVFDRATFPSFFPQGFQVSHTFPKLEKVVIVLNGSSKTQTQQQRGQYFLCRGEIFTTVQSLTLVFLIPPVQSGCLGKIRSMFQNLTRLTLQNTLVEVSRFLQQVFLHFSQLQQLILEIDTDSRRGNLDAALTGIKADLCRKLEKFVPCPMDENGKENLLKIIQNGPSLADLKELRLLKFVLRSGAAREFNKIPVLTPVSFEYGLGGEGLKNVDIFLDFHERTTREVKSQMLTALEPVLPLVTLL